VLVSRGGKKASFLGTDVVLRKRKSCGEREGGNDGSWEGKGKVLTDQNEKKIPTTVHFIGPRERKRRQIRKGKKAKGEPEGRTESILK